MPAGYKMASGLRVEMEAGYANTMWKSASAGGKPDCGADGHMSIGTFMGISI